MTNNLDTLPTALYVKIDDALKDFPEPAPWRPAVGIAPTISDVELVTLAVMSALLGCTSERRRLRRAGRDFATSSRICLSSRATTSDCAPHPA